MMVAILLNQSSGGPQAKKWFLYMYIGNIHI